MCLFQELSPFLPRMKCSIPNNQIAPAGIHELHGAGRVEYFFNCRPSPLGLCTTLDGCHAFRIDLNLAREWAITSELLPVVLQHWTRTTRSDDLGKDDNQREEDCDRIYGFRN